MTNEGSVGESRRDAVAAASLRAADARRRAQHAFDHAVQQELASLTTHEDAAARHEELARRHEAAADRAATEVEAEMLRGRAADEQARADRARERAEQVRARLRADGVDPGS